MDLPEEILKPSVEALGMLVLGVGAWLGRKVVITPFRWARCLFLIPRSIDSIAASLSEIKEGCTRQGVCLEIMLANGTYGVFECDEHGYNLSVNDTYCRMLGAVPSQLLGRGWEFFISEENRKLYAEEWEPSMAHKRDFVTEVEFTHSEGHAVPARIRAAKITKDGVHVGYMGFVQQLEEPS